MWGCAILWLDDFHLSGAWTPTWYKHHQLLLDKRLKAGKMTVI